MAQPPVNTLLNKIANRLRELRSEKGVSQVEVFNETGLHIARMETGKGNITVSTLVRLCEYYETTMSEFMKSIGE